MSRALRWGLVLALAVAVTGCFPFKKKPPAAPAAAPAPPPPKPAVPLTLTVQTSSTVNPSESGRATPIVVRVYQLRSDVSFNAAPYEKLFDDAKGTLGQDLIGEPTSVTLRPSDQSTMSLMVAGDAKFVGVAACSRINFASR